MKSPVQSRRGRRSGLVKDIVLAVAALLGLATVGWTVFAHVSGATVVVLKTGSMAPEMPQGSGALSFPTAAADLQLGDVVTARLDDSSSLVTHRVVEIEEAPDNAAARQIVLRGDANDTDDLFPYITEEVLRVHTTIPHAGAVLAVLTAPLFLGGVVLLIGMLIIWAFWPPPIEEIEEELAEHELSARRRAGP